MFIKVIAIISTLYILSVIAIYADACRENVINEASHAIVFGNKVELDGHVSRRLEARLKAAIELYVDGKVRKILVSGGLGREGYDEALKMSDYLLSKDIPAVDILLDQKGVNSSMTAKNAVRMIGSNSRVVAVTQQYHVSRAKLALRNAGFKEVYGYYPAYYEARDVYSSLREVPAWVKYFAFGL